ncbi:hypothetical protein GGQ74_001148 [Desulfobaculum xiamenense]|uniref:DUF4055 domain-containing protein n=1 Tax=Desulfobaculum xiamenense TaxID=995050 RepID=A0A846QGU6_9BACT|nr:DUF4055 domain-containing protein [Desulfobaculum xiamenense]NJB67508.1 hypothetical protein [Desulfobaculum xiamenense]
MTSIEQKHPVANPLQEHEDYVVRLRLPVALMGGTQAMRDADRAFLPQEPAESAAAYRARRDRTVLHNAYRRTVAYLTGQVFARDVVLGEDVPEAAVEFAENVDNAGNALSIFAEEVFRAGVDHGVAHILVDMPPAPRDAQGRTRELTRAEEREQRRRPYWVLVRGEHVIGWRSEVEGGRSRLTQVRIRESVSEPDGEYGVRRVERIRLLEPGRYELWEKRKGKGGDETWARIEEGVTTLDEIPLVTFMPGDRESAMTARPALEDLAYLNLAHWQSSSDQRNILHFCRVPLLFGKCLTRDEAGDIVVGPNRLIHSDSENADLKSVEHGGAAIEAGRRDLKDLEEAMALYGLQLLMPRTGNITATEKALDSAESDSTLKSWALQFRDALEQALHFTARWLGQEGGGSCEVNTEFRMQDGLDADLLLKAEQQGVISTQVVFEEFKRRGLLADSWEWREIEASFQNRPGLGLAALAGTFLRGDRPDSGASKA